MRSALVSLVMLAGIGLPATVQGRDVMVWGAGQVSCGAWLETRKVPEPPGDHRLEGRRQWLLGYLTAYEEYARGGGDILNGSDADGAFAWVDNWCSQHPLEPIFRAGFALVSELSKHR